jgi:DNA mismatch endonuclease (patch repair protein)
MDNLTKKQRAYCMSRIKSKDTNPEFLVRQIIHRMGLRFRLHRNNLPGRPDIVLPKHKKIIFVHGCFWHMHKCPYGRVVPETNTKFWQSKRQGNVARDKRNLRQLRRDGWRVLIIWECQTRDAEKLVRKLESFLCS